MGLWQLDWVFRRKTVEENKERGPRLHPSARSEIAAISAKEPRMLNLDLKTDFGARVARRLREEQIIWLTTVRADLTPQPSPVWFLWDGDTLLIYSKPNTQKLRNIARSPTVSLNLNSDSHGDDIIVITGTAAIIPQAPPADQIPAYAEKYAEAIKRIGMTDASFAQAYSTAIRVTPAGIRGF
jgi:PPOX class probable F420-dependent enzyme